MALSKSISPPVFDNLAHKAYKFNWAQKPDSKAWDLGAFSKGKLTAEQMKASIEHNHGLIASSVLDKFKDPLEQLKTHVTDTANDLFAKIQGGAGTSAPDPNSITSQITKHIDDKFDNLKLPNAISTTSDLSTKTWGIAAAGMTGITGLGHYVNNNFFKPFPSVVKSMDLKHYLMVGGAAAAGVLAARNLAHDAEQQGEKYVEQKTTTTRQRSH